MVLSLRRDDSGVASTVATMMSLLVILLFMSIALVDILPRQQNDAEFATTETAITSFEQIRGLSQGPVFATGPNTIMPATTVPIPLGTQGVSPLQAPSTGTLTFDSSSGGAKVLFQFVPHFNSQAISHIDQDIILAIDSSGSMNQNDPQKLRLSGAKEYIGRLQCPDHVAIVDFDNDAHLTKENVGGAQHHLTTVSHNCFPNFEEAKTDVDTIDASGSTNYGAALQVAVNELLGYGDPTRARVIILLTDGQNTCCPNQQGGDTLAQAQARRARDNGIVIYTIGLGSDIDEPMLRYIASVTGGTFYFASNASAIRWIYFEISRHFIGTFACGDLTTSDVGGGRLSLELRNREFPSQTLTYEAGGVVRRQSDGTGLVDGPAVGWQKTSATAASGALTLHLVALTGQDFKVDGADTQLLSLLPESRDLQEINIVKVNLTDVKNLITAQSNNLDYWTTQGAANVTARDAVKAQLNLAKTALTNGQSKSNVGNLTGAKTDVDTASLKLSAAIASAQQAAVNGTMQHWLADATTDSILIIACRLTQWVNWEDGISIEVTSSEASAWGAWLNRTAASLGGMQFIASRIGNTAILQIRAVDRLIIERRILSLSLAS